MIYIFHKTNNICTYFSDIILIEENIAILEVKNIKQIFDILIDPLGLPINCLLEYIILGIIGEIAYRKAYSYIGELYRRKIIRRKISGKIAHWVSRLFIYVPLWAAVRFLIFVVEWVKTNLLAAIIIFAAITVIVVATVIIYRYKIRSANQQNN